MKILDTLVGDVQEVGNSDIKSALWIPNIIRPSFKDRFLRFKLALGHGEKNVCLAITIDIPEFQKLQCWLHSLAFLRHPVLMTRKSFFLDSCNLLP
ncbi:hypothetical protein CEXT_578951 [Caerostris extrusa]|uniref:Uncharacterized protein n=1 Tax=Caerostris extrusa TaxID=172846 RepID=A0AAV4M9Z6_CAEEX|nr:hypothetical protein CEXT_578951 [Caerostris extrusa]